MNIIEAGNNVRASLPLGDYVLQRGANATFHAGNSVTLKCGFQVLNGASFTAAADRFFKCTQFPNGRIGNNISIVPEKK
jgi:hypothetical protein